MKISMPDSQSLAAIPGVKRVETFPVNQFKEDLAELTHSVYPHDEVYGRYCTVEEYIDCPPELVFEYMRHTRSLEEWTFSVRELTPTEKDPELFAGVDRVGGKTPIFCKTYSNREALTVDYHCAWDQGEELWMIYLNRIIPAPLVLGKPGSVVIWTNCRHPHYDRNPRPELAPKGRPWVGDFWDWFYAGHWAEIQNLKAILEYRYESGLPIGPNFSPSNA
jgi:hypothetical protein